MILDCLQQAARYEMLMPELKAGFDFLRTQANASLTEGKHDIDGDKAYAMVAKYLTRSYEEGDPESHRRYLDIQYIISGRETVYWTPLCEAGSVTQPYDEERDLIFYRRNARARTFELSAGNFAIFFPEDVHQPNEHFGEQSPVHKVIVKIRVTPMKK